MENPGSITAYLHGIQLKWVYSGLQSYTKNMDVNQTYFFVATCIASVFGFILAFVINRFVNKLDQRMEQFDKLFDALQQEISELKQIVKVHENEIQHLKKRR